MVFRSNTIFHTNWYLAIWRFEATRETNAKAACHIPKNGETVEFAERIITFYMFHKTKCHKIRPDVEKSEKLHFIRKLNYNYLVLNDYLFTNCIFLTLHRTNTDTSDAISYSFRASIRSTRILIVIRLNNMKTPVFFKYSGTNCLQTKHMSHLPLYLKNRQLSSIHNAVSNTIKIITI